MDGYTSCLLDKCVFLWFELKDEAKLDLMNDMTCIINYHQERKVLYDR